jgi:hypothetical protein
MTKGQLEVAENLANASAKLRTDMELQINLVKKELGGEISRVDGNLESEI